VAYAQANLRRREDSVRAVVDSALVRAARLDPVSGRPSYLLAIATLLPAVRKSRGFFHSNNFWHHLSARDNQRFDSLLVESFLREPFIDIMLDPVLAPEELAPPERYRETEDRAYVAYQAGQYEVALRLWSELLERSPERIDLRWHRAHVLYWQQQYDLVVAILNEVLARLGPSSDSVEVRVLPATDIVHYAIGIAYERAGQPDSAAEFYRRTLLDNLGMYMAHMRLSAILLDRGDTLNAVREISVAADIAPAEPLVLTQYGAVLVRVGRPADAIEPLTTVKHINPGYATPYLVLGIAYSDLHRNPEALAAFERFLEHAAQLDERRSWVVSRVMELRISGKKGL